MTDRRAAIEAAFDSHAEDTAPEPSTPNEAPAPESTPDSTPSEAAQPASEAQVREAPAPESPEAPLTGRARDENGRFARGAAAKPAEKPETPAAPVKPTAPAVKATTEAPTPAAAPVPEDKAPAGWKPGAREHWAKLPPEVRQEVHRRERETTLTLQETHEARAVHQAFTRAVQPYEGLIRAQGVDAVTAAGNLFQTAAALMTLPAAPKAQLVASIIQTHAVDVELLANALNGQAPASGQGGTGQAGTGHVDAAQIAQQVRQQVMQDFQQQRQAVITQNAQKKATEFLASQEFAEDVRETMGVLMATAAQRGQRLDIDAAYKMALQFHPDVSKVLTQRDAANSARNAQASTARAKAAASSIRSQPATAPGRNTGPASRRDAVEAAFEEMASR